MLNISFNLRIEKTNKQGLAPVRMTITFDSNRIRRDVKGVRVKPTHWKDQRIKPSAKGEPYNDYLEFNIILDELESKVKQIYRHAIIHGESIDVPYVTSKLNTNGPFGGGHDFHMAYDEFVKAHLSVRSKNTVKMYKTCFKFIKDFEEARNYGLSFQSIDRKFYEALRDYAFMEREILNNYFGKIITVLKTFMNWSLERGYHKTDSFHKFEKPIDEIEVIYLTMEELMSLYRHPFKSKRLEHVRDFYCLACFTGLRFSDMSNLKPSNILGHYIKLTTQKTKSVDHRIPLNKLAITILDKYKGTIYEPIPRISGQKFNDYIKECCEEVGIDQPINITRYIGQRRVDKVFPKYQLITSHTARKTFVTNSLVLGMNERVLKNITGHKDDASFKKYVQIAENFKQSEMNKTWNQIDT